ncbi:F0F1 ATP synthase subunit B [Parapedobacter sp. ISTM3]|uniref:ATP synthase subunit b n=1 Tax=Parapedobacter luteus TaxID=623280 RepID=A0A1T5BP75_9SPHI|nr:MULTISPECIES: F0F1 ATP synthase subunit B [Parapedobacter]MBK1439366.1 F0F1 ATP synthase subunit B [Parapedobacter sp. ISTM3]SKB49071.1 F-type H+-transporting ATPase subunit b [Parapedobacter luteus]
MSFDIGNPSIGLVFWTLIAFLLLLLLLRKFAWKPIMEAIGEREKSIEDALTSAEKAKAEMARLTNENEQLLKAARAERDVILKEAKALKDQIVADAKNLAQAEGAKLIEQARKEIDDQKKRALADVKNQVSSLSLEIARKVLQKEFEDERKQEALVTDLLKDVKLN